MHAITLKDLDLSSPIEAIINKNTIPPKFKNCLFDNYIPDKDYPSQNQAKERLIQLVQQIETFKRKTPKNRLLRKFLKTNKPPHIYLDGVFGVGKTHLLASIGNSYTGPKVFLSFSELMYLIAYFTLLDVVNMLSKYDIVLLDEFEVDDPGDAMMGINFVREINKTDTIVIATSNTLPSQIGARKLDLLTFKARIGTLINSFETIIIDGKDYRFRQPSLDFSILNSNLKEVFENYKPKNKAKLYVNAEELIDKLREVHPTRYRNIAYSLDAIFIENLRPFSDAELMDALRFTYLIDMLYYGNVNIFASSNINDIWDLFHEDLKEGKFKTKVGRCLSRLTEKCVLLKAG
ncbi:AFG1-family ATPase [Hippea maritima DSM 10411]|uniref:AFG1-family ATPase n=2 Tax=Hippea TaxID=84404 RepID=F2LWY6_HIPMA|nr:AFG1-family ATPase [Hippea maritima DSM 10411]